MRIAFYGLFAVALILVLVFAARSALAKAPRGLGATRGRLAPCPGRPNCVSSQADDAAHRVAPLPLAGDATTAIGRARAVVESMPRARVVAADGAYLHAEYRSLVFRFTDDLELLADPAAGVLQVRSASRVGRSDLGVNRRRVEELRRLLAAADVPR